MVTLNDALEMGPITKDNFPVCGNCHDSQKGEYKPFLVSVRGEMVCGRCAVKMLSPKNCLSCNSSNLYEAKFCSNCGEKF